jgi:hypothetical protein
MECKKKFFCFKTRVNYNFYFLLLLLLISNLDINMSSRMLRQHKHQPRFKKNLETAFISTDSANTDNTFDGNASHTTHDNTYPFQMGEEKYFARGMCTEQNCEAPYGRCENKNTCACNKGYAQLPNEQASNDHLSCNISLKSQAIFFGIELVTWIGGGHLYAGRLFYGFVKMFVFILVIIIDCILKRCLFNRKMLANNKNSFVIMSYVLYALLLLWQTFDIILIGSNLFRDGNGFKLMTWDK